MSEYNVLNVAIQTPVRRTFDYLVPDNFEREKLLPGCRIQVPFRNKSVIGILVGIKNNSDLPLSKLKFAENVLDDTVLISKNMMKLNQWASNYYQHPIGEVMLQSIPKMLREKIEKPESNTAIQNELKSNNTKLTLNAEQQHAVDSINKNKGFATFLLDGVTGSGKTEVYLQVIENKLNNKQQALILVPEISLTPQTVERFKSRFNNNISILHSRLTDKERAIAWLAAQQGHSQIVIGTRSAIFTPLPNLGVIILDEEHDLSFKQQSGFRYSARDMAIMRGQIANAPVILGSATPSMESLNNVNRKNFFHLKLPKRAGKAQQPVFNIIDVRNQYLQDGLSNELTAAMKKHLGNGNQVLLLLNRRGFSPTLLCHPCGWSAQCLKCDVNMTLHANPSRLYCHHCGASRSVYHACPSCHEQQLIQLGVGTERLEQTLAQRFSDYKIVRIDRDSTRRKGTMEKMLSDIHSGHSQILLGTQMLAKGHHFPNVTMVAIINTDTGIYSADFRGIERMGQLIVQVAGRAGRGDKPGEVYLQTHNPEHKNLRTLIDKGYHQFMKELLAERKLAQLPPSNYFALIRADARDEKLPFEFLNQVNQLAEQLNSSVHTMGPIPAPMARKAGRYHAQLLLQSGSRKKLQETLVALTKNVEGLKISRKLRWSVDVDPLEMN